MEARMTEFRTFTSGEILTDEERAKLSPADRKTYDLEKRLRILMALADDPRAAQGERESATRTIARLITLYQIDLTLLAQESGEAKPVEIVDFTTYVSNRFGIGNVRAQAIDYAVVQPLGGKTVWWHNPSHTTSTDTRLLILLPKDVVPFAKMLISSLSIQMETGMKVATAQHLHEIRWDGRMNKAQEAKAVSTFRKGYLMAWGETVGRRVRAGREDARQEASSSAGKEIALLDTRSLAQLALDAWNKERGTKTRSARPVIVSEFGSTAGRKDGRKAQLGINQLTA
jgi:hypothetical protein